jgi:hypothetical protein
VTFGVHQNSAPLLLREGAQGRLQSACALRQLELLLRARSLVRDGFEQGGIHAAGTSAALRAPCVEADVARDAERPRSEWDACLRANAALEDAPKYFSGAIVKLGRASGEAEDVARDGDDGGA